MKFVVLGRYTEQGLGGFVKNPSDNRQEAAKKITEAAGAKLIEMMTLRGAYDFIAIVEGSNFETAAGMKMLMEATGTIKDMTIMESVDFNKAAEIASKAAASYRPVGKYKFTTCSNKPVILNFISSFIYIIFYFYFSSILIVI